MKKIIYTLFSAICFSTATQAQSYQFSLESETYADLQNPLEIPIDTAVGYYEMRVPFPFTAFRDNIGDTFLISMDGFVLAGNAQNGFAFDPFVVGMHYLDQNSQVAYATTGSAGSRVFKIQWKDMGIKNMPNEKINMQAWFKEQDGSIEFHFGNSVCSAVAQSGIFFLTADFSAVHDAYWLGGNPDNPQLNENAAFKVNGIPSTGVVYRFSATPNSVKEVKQKISMTCYPNPSTGKFQLSETGINELKAVDMMGRTIEVSYDGQFFALPPSASGVYFLYGNDEEGNLFQGKIILDHRP